MRFNTIEPITLKVFQNWHGYPMIGLEATSWAGKLEDEGDLAYLKEVLAWAEAEGETDLYDAVERALIFI
jgi:hypothetical protein